MSHPDALRHLAGLVRRVDTDFSLAEAALWIAADDLPGVDPSIYLARLDAMAARVRSLVPDAADGSAERCAALLHVLFREERFAGNAAEYDDPRNSYLNEVLLKLVYLQRDDHPRAIATVEKMVLVDPLGAEHHRDLGLLYLAERAFGKAIASLERSLQLAPDAPATETAREHLRVATQMIAGWK
jgi:regulator of sirC expression with transglutaminase-like and TPR domain